jgi:hypothetical protein
MKASIQLVARNDPDAAFTLGWTPCRHLFAAGVVLRAAGESPEIALWILVAGALLVVYGVWLAVLGAAYRWLSRKT